MDAGPDHGEKRMCVGVHTWGWHEALASLSGLVSWDALREIGNDGSGWEAVTLILMETAPDHKISASTPTRRQNQDTHI